MIIVLIFFLFGIICYSIKIGRGSVVSFFIFPFMLHLILNIGGVINLGFFTNVTTVGISVDQDTIDIVVLEFFISFIVIFLVYIFILKIVGKDKINKDVYAYFLSSRSRSINFRLLIFTFFLLLFDSFYYGLPPGFFAFTGNVTGAAIQKGLILETKISGALPIIGYFIRYIPYIAFVHAMLYFLMTGRGKGTLWSLCLLFCIYSLLTLIKSYLFMPIMLYLWGLFVFGRLRIQSIVYVFSILMPIIYLTFSGLYSDSSIIFYKIFERIFLVQAEGMFLIRQYYHDFQLGALLYSSPIRHLAGTEAFDPAAEIVKHYFGEGSGWVNMNSFYTGQAFVMFGKSYILLIPLIFIFQFLLCRSILRVSLSHGFANVVLIGVCLFLPLSNNIANLVWFKDLLAVIILLPILYLLLYTKSRHYDHK